MALRDPCRTSFFGYVFVVGSLFGTSAGQDHYGGVGESSVAVCISGHARSLVEPRIYRGLKSSVVDALGGGRDTPADVFLYLALDEDSPQGSMPTLLQQH